MHQMSLPKSYTSVKEKGIVNFTGRFRYRKRSSMCKAVVSTSANISGQPSPRNFSEISEEVKSAVDYIVGYRQEEMSNPKPSSIIKLDKGGVIKIIRE